MTPLEEKWKKVEIYWEKDAAACAECEFCHTEYQSHPYGMGSATETLTSCELLEGGTPGSVPEDCPGVVWEEDNNGEENDQV